MVKAERKPIADALDFVGRVEAINRVEIRARVTGFETPKHAPAE